MRMVSPKIAGMALAVVAVTTPLTAAGCARITPSSPGPSASATNAPAPGETGATKLPSDWPADVPVPSLPLKNALSMTNPSGPAFSAIFHGPGDPGKILAALNDQFRAAGFASQSSFGSGPDGGVAVWKKGSERVQVMVTTQNGEVVVSEHVMIDNGKN